jgi:hypothetical protein
MAPEQRRVVNGIAAQVEGLTIKQRTPEEIEARRRELERRRRPAGRPRKAERPDGETGLEAGAE